MCNVVLTPWPMSYIMDAEMVANDKQKIHLLQEMGFCSGVSRLFSAQGSPSSGSLVNL